VRRVWTELFSPGLVVLAVILIAVFLLSQRESEPAAKKENGVKPKNPVVVGSQSPASGGAKSPETTPTDGWSILILENILENIPKLKIPEETTTGGSAEKGIASQPPTIAPAPAAPKETAGKTELKNFGNAMGTVFKRHLDMEREAAIFQEAIKNPSTKTLLALGELSASHQKLADEFGVIPAPAGAEKIRQELAASYSALALAIAKLTPDNSATTTIPAQKWVEYSDNAVRAAKAFVAAAEYLENNGIIFEANEPGAVFSFSP